MLQSVAFLAEGDKSEVPVFGGHVDFHAFLYQRFLSEAVGYQVADGDNLDAEFLGLLHELGHTGHGAVLVHDLDEGSCGLQACQASHVNGGLGVAGAFQYALVLCIKRVDVAGTSKGAGGGGWVSQCLDGSGAVVCRYTGSTPFQFVYGDGKGSAEDGGVVADLLRRNKSKLSLRATRTFAGWGGR